MQPTPTTRKPTDFTEGSVIGAIVKMGLPSMFGFLAQHIYAMVDMFWVSRLPEAEAAVAAITFFNNMMWFLYSFNSLVGPGSVAIISRRYGEKDYRRAERSIKETFFLKLVFGLMLGGPAWFFIRSILALLGAEGDALTLGINYGQIYLVGLPIMFATYSIFTALRGVANPNAAMVLMLGSNVINLVLDPFLIFGWAGFPALGIRGAAVASVAGFALTFVAGMIYFRSGRTNVRLGFSGGNHLSGQSMFQMVKIGIPAFLGELSFSGSRLILTPLVAGFGTAVVAAFGVATQLFAFGISILVGLGLGLSALIGQTIGAGKLERARNTGDKSILIGIGIMGVMGVLTLLLAPAYLGLFFDDAETISIGTELLYILALGFPFYGALLAIEQIHFGVGLNVPVMIINSVQAWLLQVLPAVIVTQFLGMDETAVWWVISISGMLSAFLFYQYYRRGRWLTNKV